MNPEQKETAPQMPAGGGIARIEERDLSNGMKQCFLHLFHDISELKEPQRMLFLGMTTKALSQIKLYLSGITDSEARLELAKTKGKFVSVDKQPKP